jgi:hypothetical protein
MVYVRPTLEYASAVWSPTVVGLTHYDLENVQRRFTKRLHSLRAMSYDEFLSHLQLETLQTKRQRADTLLAFKVLHGLVDVNAGTLGLVLSTAPTTGQGIHLVIHRATSSRVASTYCYRIGHQWNCLTNSVAKQATSKGRFNYV